MMIPEELEILISRYDDDDLSESQRSQVETVLADDAEAREMLGAYRRLNAALAGLAAGSERVDFAGFGQGVRESIGQWEAGQRQNRWRVWAAAAVAVAAVMAVAVGWLGVWQGKSQPTGQPSGQREVTEVALALEQAMEGARIMRVSLGEPKIISSIEASSDIQVEIAYQPAGLAAAEGQQTEVIGEVVWCCAGVREVGEGFGEEPDNGFIEVFF